MLPVVPGKPGHKFQRWKYLSFRKNAYRSIETNHSKMYNTANTVTAGWCSSLKSNWAWDKRNKNIGSSWKTHGKLVFCRMVTTKFLVNKDTDTAITKFAKLPNLIACEIWWSSTRCLSPNQEFATNPSFKPIFLVLNNSPLVQGKKINRLLNTGYLRRVLEQFSLTWPKVHWSNFWHRLSE